ncbi:PilZ domain-containing protein [Luteimonas sp. BDR2-5]|uniref:PilZ domain-containing protein n=1 Tax=Proluteimonas luteida TaxID=2878685 RepID=UPI001E64F1B4|nr:PilZ domain-containing protein [Luteimonas sp. BDR2-5]MCD9027104.1 PilZ domain-containing protein [Luteimonas sp. BDR2-5]
MIQEFRRARRRKASDLIQVTDVMAERIVGRIGNLSETGMLLIATEPLVEDALYQLAFVLPDAAGTTPVEVGAHLLWRDDAALSGSVWAGFRFIATTPALTAQLHGWVSAPGGHYE